VTKHEALALFFSFISLAGAGYLGYKGNNVQKRVLKLEEERRSDEKV